MAPLQHQIKLAIATLGGLLAAQSALAGGFVVVTNSDDSGVGSLRNALEIQNATEVFIAPEVSDIQIYSPLTYAATEGLTIWGSGQIVHSSDNITLLQVTNGADLTIANLDFAGPGGFHVENRGDLFGQQAGKGIFIDVPTTQVGDVKLNLSNVAVTGVANHGIHVSDCSLADDCGSGSGGGGDGSPASIIATFNNVSISDVGNGKFDADGFRVDERGMGNIVFNAVKFSADSVGADGTELDEGDQGDVITTLHKASFTNNGNYCNPDILNAWLPAEPEGEFAEEENVTEADIPAEVNGSPDDNCFEREVSFYDDDITVEEYEFGLDLDDGIDIDEAGEGSIVASMTSTLIKGNLDEGVDFDEEQAGGVAVRFFGTRARANNDDGFKVSEEDDGSVSAVIVGVKAKKNGGKGIVLEEENDGNLAAIVRDTIAVKNDDSDDTGIEAVQDDAGTGTIEIRNSAIIDGLDLDGVSEI